MHQKHRQSIWTAMVDFIISRPALVLTAGGLLTLGLVLLTLQAGLERRAADACALAMLATAALTASVLGWIFAHVRKAKPTPEQQLIQEVMDELEMEERLKTSSAAEKQSPSQNLPQRQPWEKPDDWWKEGE